MSEKIQACYDSHTHFWATGQVAQGLKLHHLETPNQVSELRIEAAHHRAHWLVGFGWNHHAWPGSALPDKSSLDTVFPDKPVFFSRVDGHASWINSAAIAELKKNGYDFSRDPAGGIIQRDTNGAPTGLLLDQAHINAFLKLPEFTSAQHLSFLKTAQQIFNRAGFTHVRDLSMNSFFWQLLCEMEARAELTVCLDAFQTVENLSSLPAALVEIKAMQNQKSEFLRMHGVKIFIDGSLGSRTALLSQPYPPGAQKGLLIWPEAEIRTLLRESWRAGLQVAIHTLGDEAVHVAVSAARAVSAEGMVGRLHLEHVQLLRPETLKLMKPLHITCHMQPCHWLSDHTWLNEVLPAELRPCLFQWELLRRNKIPLFFGSDSPIEKPALWRTRAALEHSAAHGVGLLEADWKQYHRHPDAAWGQAWTEFDGEKILKVYFNNKPLW